MYKHIRFLLAIMLVFFFSSALAIQPPSNTYEQQAKVQSLLLDVMSYITSHGKAATLEALNMQKGPFSGHTLYAFAYTTSGKNKGLLLANGATTEDVGKNRYMLQDVKGHYLIQDILKAAEQGGGWVTYYWHNPEKNNAIEQKWSYVVPVDKDWCIGAGFYTTS